MSKPRKQIILNEILFWKQNKLLPEHYCDFLATLYTEGEHEETEQEKKAKQAVLAKEKRTNIVMTTLLTIVGILSFVGMFALSAYTAVCAIIAAGVTALLFVRAAVIALKHPSLAVLYHIMAALLIFGITIYISTAYFPGNDNLLFLALLFNSALWLITGLKRNLLYFTLSGALAGMIVVGYWLYLLL